MSLVSDEIFIARSGARRVNSSTRPKTPAMNIAPVATKRKASQTRLQMRISRSVETVAMVVRICVPVCGSGVLSMPDVTVEMPIPAIQKVFNSCARLVANEVLSSLYKNVLFREA